MRIEPEMRTIAATFEQPRSAEFARQRLFETSVHPEHVAIAPAVVSTSDDGPIEHPRTIVAVIANGNAGSVRDALQSAGGHLVADVDLDD